MNRINPARIHTPNFDTYADEIAAHVGEYSANDPFKADHDVRRHGRHEAEPHPIAVHEALGSRAVAHIDVHILSQAAVPSKVDLNVARRYRESIEK